MNGRSSKDVGSSANTKPSGLYYLDWLRVLAIFYGVTAVVTFIKLKRYTVKQETR